VDLARRPYSFVSIFHQEIHVLDTTGADEDDDASDAADSMIGESRSRIAPEASPSEENVSRDVEVKMVGFPAIVARAYP
jgi:hypothetical protein